MVSNIKYPGRFTVAGMPHALLIAALLPLCLMGCMEEPLEYTEVKRVDETITPAELQTFLSVIETLPNQKLPPLQSVFPPPPDWNPSRTLPVGELVNESQELLAERWSVDWQARHVQRNRHLARALRREQLTTQQFIGIAFSLGVAMARNTIRENQDLNKIIERGEKEIAILRKDLRPFSSLSQEGRHRVLQRAIWISRLDRADKLVRVPAENLLLVQEQAETLSKIFPEDFQQNPLDSVVDFLEEFGLPFEETEESGFDDQISWDKSNVIRGYDRAR